MKRYKLFKNYATTKGGFRVHNLRKSKPVGWEGEIQCTNYEGDRTSAPLKWNFDFTYSKVEIYIPDLERKVYKFELNIVELPVGFDWVPNLKTRQEMQEVIMRMIKAKKGVTDGAQ